MYFGMSRYDEVVHKGTEGSMKSVLPDAPQAQEDCERVRAYLKMFNIDQDEDVYNLSENPS